MQLGAEARVGVARRTQPGAADERLLRQDVDRLADDRDRPVGESAGEAIGEVGGRRDRGRGIGAGAEIKDQIEREVGGLGRATPGVGRRAAAGAVNCQLSAVSCSSRVIA